MSGHWKHEQHLAALFSKAAEQLRLLSSACIATPVTPLPPVTPTTALPASGQPLGESQLEANMSELIAHVQKMGCLLHTLIAKWTPYNPQRKPAIKPAAAALEKAIGVGVPQNTCNSIWNTSWNKLKILLKLWFDATYLLQKKTYKHSAAAL